jgi:uncharacterized protein YodC (DUF2158 family)
VRYNFIWFLNLTDGEVYLIQLYLIFDSHRWWGVLDTTLSDFWISPMVRCTWYNFIWFLTLTNKIKLYQVHLTIGESKKSDKVVSRTPHHRWDSKNQIKLYQVHLTIGESLSDFLLSPMVRCTWYNFIWFLSFTDGEVYLIQLYLIFESHRCGESKKSDKVVSSTPHHLWKSKIR